MSTPTSRIDPQEHLAQFGLSSFRDGQREVIDALLSGEDCLCVMPTGGGKSLCFQLPAVARQGTALVVSPLIALMKDQVDSLEKLDIRATFINSSLPPAEQHARMAQMAHGQYDLVYIAPERLRNPRFLDAALQTKVQLLAVDEAHCISEWGHDFRPDYARLGQFRQRLNNPQTIALTATATPTVRSDVVQLLSMREPRIFITGFARPNLHLEVQSHSGAVSKETALLEFLDATPGAGIIYASTRKRCDQLQELLSQRTKRRIGVYHAGLLPDQRQKAQDEFMNRRCEVVVATNAFGMGIDRADLRFVVHYNIPGSLEAYYQEAGRAGRDYLDSRCLLLFSASDRYVQEFFIENSYPSREVVAQVYNFLRAIDQDPIEITQQELKEQLNLSLGGEGVGACEQLLEKCGALERLIPRQNMAAFRIDSDLGTLVDTLPREAKTQRKVLRALERISGQLRYERVYFHVDRLADDLDLSRDAMARAMRELNKLAALDYVPPFRGRAVRMLQRDKTFDELTIDFQQLQQRKAAEYEKLERMIRYARTPRCRQMEIINYFGDDSKLACGSCDNCRASTNTISVATQGDVSESDQRIVQTLRIVLSGVARTQGRFGKQVVSQMLWGSSSAKMAKLKFDALSTFGLLKHLRQSEIVELLDETIRLGLVQQVEIDRYRPVVQLTERGISFMRSESMIDEPISLSRNLVEKLRPSSAIAPSANVPSSVVRVDSPQSAQPSATENLLVRNASPKMELLREEESPLSDQSSFPDQTQPSYYWTWRLFSEGYTVAEIAQIRRLDSAEMVDHALRALENGLKFQADWLLSAEQISALESLELSASPQPIRSMLEQLPQDIRYEHVQLYLKCLQQKQVCPK